MLPFGAISKLVSMQHTCTCTTSALGNMQHTTSTLGNLYQANVTEGIQARKKINMDVSVWF